MSNLKKDFENKFRAIGTQIGCDKVLYHSYEGGYANCLWELENSPIKILEIGIGGEGYADGGQSLLLWKNLFPKAEIFGLDIYDKSKLNCERVNTRIINQADKKALEEFAEVNGPFDLIVDDGSHHRADVLISLFALMPYVKDGGYYVIEDISTSYWPTYEGSTIANGFQNTPIDWVKKLVDVVHKHDQLTTNNNLPDWDVKSISVFNGIVFLETGQARVLKNIPVSSGFYVNQLNTDRARYGKFEKIFNEFYNDPLSAIAPLINDL